MNPHSAAPLGEPLPNAAAALLNAPKPLLDQLRLLAGVGEWQRHFALRTQSCEIRVQYDNNDSEERAVLLASFPDTNEAARGGYRGAALRPIYTEGPVGVYLREETASDQRRKLFASQPELQTGDADFDATVFVETQTVHHLAGQLLKPEAARGAIVQLLQEGCPSIVLDDWSGNIVVHLPKPYTKSSDPQKAKRLGRALEALRASLPPVVRPMRSRLFSRQDESPLRIGLLVPIVVVVSALLGSVIAALVAGIFYLVMIPNQCWIPSNYEEGVRYLSCHAPTCCAPFDIGMGWGQHIVAASWILGFVGFFVTMLITKGRMVSWALWAAIAGLAVPFGLALGVIAARIVY